MLARFGAFGLWLDGLPATGGVEGDEGVDSAVGNAVVAGAAQFELDSFCVPLSEGYARLLHERYGHQ